MQLIPDLIREILLTIEEKGTNYDVLTLSDFEYPEYDDDTVAYNMKLLLDEDYIIGKVQSYSDGSIDTLIDRMTMAGHKYLDNVRDGVVWEETKRTICSKLKSVSINIISTVASAIIMKKLGL